MTDQEHGILDLVTPDQKQLLLRQLGAAPAGLALDDIGQVKKQLKIERRWRPVARTALIWLQMKLVAAEKSGVLKQSKCQVSVLRVVFSESVSPNPVAAS